MLKRSRLFFTLILLTVFAAACSTNQPEDVQTEASEAQVVQGQYIVVLNSGLNLQSASPEAFSAEVQSVASSMGVQMKSDLQLINAFVTENMSASDVARLEADPRVKYVEKDTIVSISQQSNPPAWGIDRIDQRRLPLNKRYNYGTDGRGVNIYIIDTGINPNHNEFRGRVGRGFDALDGGAPDDCNGHGTHVASTAAGTRTGVAKGATVYGVRVLDCEGFAPNSEVIEGMQWVARNAKKPAVANMSLGGGASKASDDAATALVRAGITTAVAAGNHINNRIVGPIPNGGKACNTSPARARDVITVAATDIRDSRAPFSNFDNCVEIFAPGAEINGADWRGNNDFRKLSGTSMASPHVAGAAARILQSNRRASPAQVLKIMRDSATRNIIKDPKGSPNLMLYMPSSGNPNPGNPNPGDPGPKPDPNNMLFDFGTPNSPLQAGYTRVSEKTTKGDYYWKNQGVLHSRDRGAQKGINNLNRDFVFGKSPRTFEAKARNGRYRVLVTLGDTKNFHDRMAIKAEGKLAVQGIGRPAGPPKNTREFIVDVRDGAISIEFSDRGGRDPHWVVNRVAIRRVR